MDIYFIIAILYIIGVFTTYYVIVKKSYKIYINDPKNKRFTYREYMSFYHYNDDIGRSLFWPITFIRYIISSFDNIIINSIKNDK